MATTNLMPAEYTEVLGNIVELGIPLFDFEYSVRGITKAALETAFVDRYYFREIGSETIPRFKHFLRTRWLEVIDDYSALFELAAQVDSNAQDMILTNHSETEHIESDDTDTVTRSGSDNTDTTTAGTTSTEGRSVYNDTPKGVVAFDDAHASSITKDNNTANNSDHGTTARNYNENTNRATGTDKTVTRKGLTGTPFGEIIRFKANMLHAVQSFLDEFKDLFFLLY